MQGHSFGSEPTTVNITNAANADRVLVASSGAIATGSIRNEVASGISLLNSGSNNIGAIVVALNTTNRTSITVSYVAEQLNSGGSGATDRINGLRLQYRVGTSGSFTDVSPVQDYLATNTASVNAAQTFSGIALPAACENQAVVQLRWIYFVSSGSANSRDRIRLDDISVTSTPASSSVVSTGGIGSLSGFTYVSGSGPSSSQSFTITGSNLTAPVSITPSGTFNYEYSIDGGSSWLTTATSLPNAASVSQAVQVRLAAGLATGPYNSQSLTVASAGAAPASIAVSLSGSVTNPPCAAPNASAGPIAFSNVTASTTDGSFPASSPAADGYLVFYSTNASAPAVSSGTVYNSGNSPSGYTFVQSGAGTSFSQSALDPSTTYYYYAFAYNNSACSGGPAYAAALSGSQATSTAPPCVTPAVSGAVVFGTPGSTSLPGSFAASSGGATGYLVAISTSSSLGAAPSGTYTAGNTIGNGTVVSFSASTSFIATGLTPSTPYYVFVYAYNNSACSGGPAYASEISNSATTSAAPVFNYAAGDWRPLYDGADFSFSTAWERYDGTSWVAQGSNTPQNQAIGSKPLRIVIDKLAVTAGGSSNQTYNDIIIADGGELIINDINATPSNLVGSGKKLQVENGGKLTVNGDMGMPGSASTPNFIVQSGGTVVLNNATLASNSLIWSGNEDFQSGSNVIINNWNYGIATASLRALINPTPQISDNSTGGYYFGNLTLDINNASANDWVLISGSTTAPLCENDLTIINNSAARFIAFTANTITLHIGGSLVHSAGKFAFGANFNTNTGNQVFNIGGGLEMDGEGYFKFHSSTSNNGYTALVNVKGDVNLYNATALQIANQGISATAVPVLTLNGTTGQTIEGVATVSLPALTVSKTSGDLSLGSQDLNVTGTLTMAAGNINTGTHALILGSSAASRGTLAYTGGYVTGKMKRWFSSTNSGNASGLFPISNGTQNRSVTVEYTSAPLSGGTLTAQLVNTQMGTSFGTAMETSCGSSFNIAKSSAFYWQIDAGDGLTNDGNSANSGSYSLTMKAESLPGYSVPCELLLVKRDGSNPWTASGAQVDPVVNGSVVTLKRTAASGWSDWGVAGSAANPLPVKGVVAFTARRSQQTTVLNWTLAEAASYRTLQIERSTDGRSFSPLAEVFPAERSFTDPRPFNGRNYYRIALRDDNGLWSYSAVASVLFGSTAQVSLFPNPASHELKLQWTGEGAVTIELSNLFGQVVSRQEVSGTAASMATGHLPAGQYLLTWKQGTELIREKVQVVH